MGVSWEVVCVVELEMCCYNVCMLVLLSSNKEMSKLKGLIVGGLLVLCLQNYVMFLLF